MGDCLVPACRRPSYARGACKGHYCRLYRNGANADLVTLIRTDRPSTANPWAAVAPPCPFAGHPPEQVYLWHPDPEDGFGRWVCSPCARRFAVTPPGG